MTTCRPVDILPDRCVESVVAWLDGTGRRASVLDDYQGYLLQRWNVGCADAATLTWELRARGYRGSYVLGRTDRFIPGRHHHGGPGPAAAVRPPGHQLEHDQPRQPARQ